MARLSNEDFSLYKKLAKLVKSGKATPEEEAKFKELDAIRNGDNDESWYSVEQSVLDAAGSFSFGTYPGQKIDVGSILTSRAPAFGKVVWITPTLGVNSQASDPINIAGRKNYAFVRRANSGAKNYEHPDLTIYNIGYYSCILGLMVGNRVLRLVPKFSIMNKTLPLRLLEAIHFNWDDISRHYNDYRARIKLLSHKLQTLSVPKGQTIINRWSFLFENVFVDGDTNKASWIVPMPTQLYEYDSELEAFGGCLKPVDILHTNFSSFSDYLDILERMINALVSDDDSAMMSGDQLKAYGDNGVLIYDVNADDSDIQLVKSEDFLLQLHNALCVGRETGSNLVPDTIGVIKSGSLYSTIHIKDSNGDTQEVTRAGVWITQMSGQLICQPKIALGTYSSMVDDGDDALCRAIYFRRYMDTWKSNPTPGEMMEMTRFNYKLASISRASGVSYDVEHLAEPSSIVIGYSIGDSGTELLHHVDVLSLTTSLSSQIVDAIDSAYFETAGFDNYKELMALSNFDWHHALYCSEEYRQGVEVFAYGHDPDTAYVLLNKMSSGAVFDTENFTTISPEDIQKLNNLAVYSEVLIRI